MTEKLIAVDQPYGGHLAKITLGYIKHQ